MGCTWNSPGQNTEVGSLSLLQGIFPTQGLNPGLPHCRQILYQLSHEKTWLKHYLTILFETRSYFYYSESFCCFSENPSGGFEVLIWRINISSVQSLSRVRLFATPWIAARQASLSITNSQSLLKRMPIQSVMPSSHLILCRPLLLLPPILPSITVFSVRGLE